MAGRASRPDSGVDFYVNFVPVSYIRGKCALGQPLMTKTNANSSHRTRSALSTLAEGSSGAIDRNTTGQIFKIQIKMQLLNVNTYECTAIAKEEANSQITG